MEQPNIDYKAIAADISNRCNQLLQCVDVNTVSDTFAAVQELVEIAIEKYSYSVSEYWMAMNSDADISRKIKFTDVENGYENLVKKWVNQNPFKADYPECPENLTESYEEYAASLNKKAIATAVAGTAVIGTAYASASCAKGWLIFGNPIVAIAAELIGLAALYTVVQNKKKTKRQEIDIQAKELEEQLKGYKNSLISSLTVSAESYIKNFVAFSDDILTSF